MQALRIFAICAFVGLVSSSAIPMWEYLTQNEKVMYLFNMFQSQVQDYCKTDACKQDLKNYGWKKLKAMDENSLDLMDPFQRGSSEIIWESIMEGHKIMENKKPKTSTTTAPNNFYEEDAYDANQEASAKIETVYKAAPPKGFVYERPQIIVGSGTPEYRKPILSYPSSNAIQESTTERGPGYENYVQNSPLTGPWVVRVHPDGTPVRESTQTVPEDDDLRLYQMTKVIFENL